MSSPSIAGDAKTFSATSLELDPKFFARVAYNPIAATASPQELHDVLQVALVRFDDVDASRAWRTLAVSGWSPGGDNCHECFSSVSLPPGTQRCSDWHAARMRNCWFGVSRNGRFGLVVPVRSSGSKLQQSSTSPLCSPRRSTAADTPTAEPAVGSSRSVLVPRAIAILPPYSAALAAKHRDERNIPRNSDNAAIGSDQIRSTSMPFAMSNMSFIDGPSPSFMSTSFAYGSPLFNRPTAVFGAVSGDSESAEGTTPAFGETAIEKQETPSSAPVLPQVPMEPPVMVAETLLSEGLTGSRAVGISNVPIPRQSTLLGPCPWNPSLKIEGSFTNAGDLLPLFFSQRPGVTASAFVQWAAKAGSSKLGHDVKQFVALVGDSRGLFLLTPGRDPARHIAQSSGITPIHVDSSTGVATLDRGVYELSISGMLGSSSSASNAGYFAHVAQRYSLLTTQRITSLLDVVVQSTRTSRKQPLQQRSNDMPKMPQTKICELLFSQKELTCESLLELDDLEGHAETVSSVHMFDTHANWGEAVDLGAGAGPSKKSRKKK